MDRRQQKTRQAIFQALSGLLTEKRFHQITVEEIAQRANIGRSTFYAHFETKEELLAQMCREIFSHVLAPGLEGEDTHDFSLERDPYALVTHLLYHIRDKRRDLAAIIAGGQGEGSGDLFSSGWQGLFWSGCWKDGTRKRWLSPIPFWRATLPTA